ncbi:MAG: hypothetical protein Q7S33_06000 [Nanoarchaeota archaeon]|nr:hypothetical protein [Nanoarchaeota archaeon]
MKLTNLTARVLTDLATDGQQSKTSAIENRRRYEYERILLDIFGSYTNIAEATMIDYESKEYKEKLIIGRAVKEDCEIAYKWWMFNPDLGGDSGLIIYLNNDNFIGALLKNGIFKLSLIEFADRYRKYYGAKISINPDCKFPKPQIEIKDNRLEELARLIYGQVGNAIGDNSKNTIN